MRINVAYAIPPQSLKAEMWHDGFTAALDLLAREHEVRRLNVHPEAANLDRSVDALADCDFLLAKSTWGWTVDQAVRRYAKDPNVVKGIVVSGQQDPPGTPGMRFYDVVYYQNDWYKSRVRKHPHKVHAFGIDTDVMRSNGQRQRDIDWLSVGMVVDYKRQESLVRKSGRRVLIGDLSTADNRILQRLRAGGVEVHDYMPYEQLANFYRRARNVLEMSTLHGGGDRQVLEARACGACVQIASDNPRLQGLIDLPAVWDQRYLANQLAEGIELARARPIRQSRRRWYVERLRSRVNGVTKVP